MTLNDCFKRKLYPIFLVYDYKIIEETDNLIKCKSNQVLINLCYNNYEKTYFIEMGYLNDDTLYPLDIFTKLHNNNLELFVDELVFFFKSDKGKILLKGNLNLFIQDVIKRSKCYTLKVITKQNIQKANEAWDNKDYKLFVDLIESLDLQELPNSILFKYKLAKDKL